MMIILLNLLDKIDKNDIADIFEKYKPIFIVSNQELTKEDVILNTIIDTDSGVDMLYPEKSEKYQFFQVGYDF
jgi:hypothetical protein